MGGIRQETGEDGMENLTGQMCYVCLPGEGYVNEEECGDTMGRDGGVEGREGYT